ncbi:ThiF family protein [Theileria parva strain Muguga]|uniref:ThiF family protein n=1 Tax=Theileria parva strain Muguga TaxID=333668 RepID=UPI001C61F147|nr:ThiF family protein [Theileria parva strain Muguga]EAN33839.2 ThiF family protein [Theileria parva strain Muguga]
MNNVLKSRILVVGSGGLGCELLKSLVLNGFENISIVDFDKVVLSNLNRQFLFQKNDVGKFKSQIAFENIKPWNTSKFPQFYVGRVEELSLKLLSEFDVIFSALDTIQSRRWLNSAFFEIYRFYNISNTNSQLSEDNSLKILIDGGSQDLYGHVRVIRPGFTSCLECSLTLYSSEDPFPCILTDNLQSPEDCINYSLYIYFDYGPSGVSPTGTLDENQEGLLEYIYENSKMIAESKHIKGVTLDLVNRICNRAILNIPTTNSIISSLMVNVLLTQDFNYNFYFYSGDGITNLSKFKLQPDQNCVVCNCKCIKLKVKLEMKLVDLLRVLYKKISVDSINISSDLGVIYFDNPKSLSDLYAYRLNMKLSDLKDVLSGKLYLTSKDSQTWIIYLIFQ